jgi:hypothetical protein
VASMNNFPECVIVDSVSIFDLVSTAPTLDEDSSIESMSVSVMSFFCKTLFDKQIVSVNV